MSKRVTFQHSRRPSMSRVSGAVVAAGLGASMVFGAGAAFASGTTGTADTAALAGAATADSVAQQATAQSKAAAAAKKASADKEAAAKKKAASWRTPVSHYVLSATYGTGGDRWASKHSGQDFAVPIGTKVEAAHAGTVVKAGPNGGGDGPAYGNAIVIKHANGKYSQYAHLSKIQVKIGDHVKTGEKIALSGNTGNSSGPHLHFEIRTTANYGSAINPVSYLNSVHVHV
ncbi:MULTISPECIES: M23 family metallopeptidase [unclassified Streptomyces]|uniref:M23 family metallopeptidase n=1 Tax=Streptomyces TaxID=1883 RepID=UPI0001C1C1D5|nr:MULTISPECIES: M23 family metallopeptidase [unclassified Streptomyces]AEN10695.1 Peptidase M23 [Streptomyces sp. SirexAA-E]MYR65372.1 peptidoglycan DD-metalloendopeptidase family protein [Streptomyces sp. SID4939]MYS02486.1 peptidoglycan DD-metalloendopeptidase family protein [Streptomyces sp. SID4940]MYT62604.1 peptidoglycan DD-metalloendopeptidase family protein [Streptomyces sp. SID8357]MYT89412.1 peptidoglycan DD-metalloendopeptidase family protein [Streptomyces sp. SID8360]